MGVWDQLRNIADSTARADQVEHVMKSAPCKNAHSQMYKRGSVFCSQCGQKLVLECSCPTCGRNFFSIKAFRYHILMMHRHDCPICRKKGAIKERDRGWSDHGARETSCSNCLCIWKQTSHGTIYAARKLAGKEYNEMRERNGTTKIVIPKAFRKQSYPKRGE